MEIKAWHVNKLQIYTEWAKSVSFCSEAQVFWRMGL